MVRERTSELSLKNEQLRDEIEERKRVEKALQIEKAKIQETLAQVKKLGGLLPICASCKKIRDDKGYWSQIEGYIQNHSDVEFSHSLCPECAKILYPDFVKPDSF